MGLEAVLANIKKGAHVLVEGSLVSPTYEQPNGKGKKSKTSTITSWSVMILAEPQKHSQSAIFMQNFADHRGLRSSSAYQVHLESSHPAKARQTERIKFLRT
jgi:single-stranded DNA-binding protein